MSARLDIYVLIHLKKIYICHNVLLLITYSFMLRDAVGQCALLESQDEKPNFIAFSEACSQKSDLENPFLLVFYLSALFSKRNVQVSV